MPFTISHAAAVIPLARRPLVASALVAGAFAPDLAYYVLLRPAGRGGSHSWWGVFAIDLPYGVALLVLWHALLAEPLLALAPEQVRLRLAPLAERARRALWPPRVAARVRVCVWVAVSVVIGAATHVLWDECTHPHGWVVQAFTPLQAGIGGIAPAFKLFQWGSSVLGLLVVLAWCAWRTWRTPPEGPVAVRYTPPRSRAVVITVVVAIGLGLGLLNAFFGGPVHLPDGDYLVGPGGAELRRAIVRTVVGTVTGTAVALAGYGLLRLLRRR